MVLKASWFRFMIAAVLAFGASACGGLDSTGEEFDTVEQEAHSRRAVSATLRDANGAFVGTVKFTPRPNNTVVSVSARLVDGANGIHGFHVHANNDPANGDGCVAPTFVSADGHYNPTGATHGDHAGDMPAIFFPSTGVAQMAFNIDRFDTAEIRGRAVILHALPDNYGNVPVGAAADQYTPNSDAAITATQATGNAGARIACGVID